MKVEGNMKLICREKTSDFSRNCYQSGNTQKVAGNKRK